MKNLTITFILLFSALSIFSQSTQKMLGEADKKFKNKEYAAASVLYSKVLESGNRSRKILEKLGDAYYYNGDTKNAFEWYAELITTTTNYDPEYLFKYAQSLRAVKLYKEGDEAIRKYYQIKGLDSGQLLAESPKKHLEKIEKQQDYFSVHDFGHNTPKDEFSPHIKPNGRLLFMSNRNPMAVNKSSNNMRVGMSYYLLDNNNRLTLSEGKLNLKTNTLTSTYSKSRDTVYFTASQNRVIEQKDIVLPTSVLYRGIQKNGEWYDVKKLSIPGFSSIMQPCLHPNGKKLFFSSKLKANSKHADIFVMDIRKDGRFVKPKNLGTIINTLGNELFPYVAKNGDLYFSSDGHFGLGGLDLFVSKWKNGKYQTPVNLGAPLNSENNDISITYNTNLDIGYMVSNRNNSFDIFEIQQLKGGFGGCSRMVSGTIRNTRLGKPVPYVKVTVLNENLKEVVTSKSNIAGQYELRLPCDESYYVRFSRSKYKTTEELFHVGSDSKLPTNKNVYLLKGDGLLKTWKSNYSEVNLSSTEF